MAHVLLDRLHEFGDEVIALGELHLDGAEGLVDRIATADEIVVEDYPDGEEDDAADDEDHECLLWEGRADAPDSSVLK
jgi:hypothetical protein